MILVDEDGFADLGTRMHTEGVHFQITNTCISAPSV